MLGTRRVKAHLLIFGHGENMAKNPSRDLLIQGFLPYFLLKSYGIISIFVLVCTDDPSYFHDRQFSLFLSQKFNAILPDREKEQIILFGILIDFISLYPSKLSQVNSKKNFLLSIFLCSILLSLSLSPPNFLGTSCRGYYRCSTSKGCSAKKQVERCRTDASMLIITYTSSHNHPGPERPTTSPNQEPKEAQTQTIEDPSRSPKQDQSIITSDEDDHFHYLQINGSQGVTIGGEENPNPLEKINDSIDLLFDEEPLSYPHLMTFSTPKSEENDFFDELEELPIPSSSLTSFMRSNFFDERILILPS